MENTVLLSFEWLLQAFHSIPPQRRAEQRASASQSIAEVKNKNKTSLCPITFWVWGSFFFFFHFPCALYLNEQMNALDKAEETSPYGLISAGVRVPRVNRKPHTASCGFEVTHRINSKLLFFFKSLPYTNGSYTRWMREMTGQVSRKEK